MKYLTVNLLIILFITILPGRLFSQEFGGFKPSKVWKKLETERYRIVYSAENEMQARNVAATIDRQYLIPTNIGTKRKKIVIILQNSTTNTNGYVGLAPFVSEFYLTPLASSFEIGSLPWSYTLALHEYQHVLQFTNAKKGITQLGYYFGGEQIWSFLNFLSIPNWFFEGDAVRAETQFSHQGRGRIPYFFNGFRAFAQENDVPRYDKLRNGSFQDYVPSHYQLGYLLSSYGLKTYGNQFWPTVLSETAKFKGIIYPMSQALKRHSGSYSKQFYKTAFSDFAKQWKDTKNEIGHTIYQPNHQEVVQFEFPQFDVDSSLYYYGSSYDKIGKIYHFKNGESDVIMSLGLRNSNYFDVFNGKILTTQTYFDPRWTWTDYSDVILFDSNTQQRTKITQKGKYFHPSFSPDGNRIVALQSNPNHQFNLEIIELSDTSIKQRIPNPFNYYYSFPIWSDEKTIISCIRDSVGKMGLAKIDLATFKHEVLFSSYHIIGKPTFHDSKIYFTASFSGIDNLYEWDGNKINQLTEKGSGRYQIEVVPNGDSIYFTNFSLQGNLLKKAPLQIIKYDYQINELKNHDFYQLSAYNDSLIIPATALNNSIEEESYSKFKHLVNIHSWGLLAEDPLYKIELNSDNVLNTLDLNAGYQFNRNESNGGFYVDMDYGQYFLHLNAALSTSQRKLIFENEPAVYYSENKSAIGLSLPLKYSSNLFYRNLFIKLNYEYSNLNFEQSDLKTLDLHASNFQLIYRQAKLKARKNIFTSFGVYTRLIHRNGFDEEVSQLLSQNSLALKGLAQNHNLIIDVDAQIENGSSAFRFSNLFNYPRGYESNRFTEFYKLSANYHLPLFYPDIGALGIAYIMRMRANVFYDYSIALQNQREFNSTGIEVIFDLRLLRALPLSMGLRYTNIFSQKSLGLNSRFELFIPFNRF